MLRAAAEQRGVPRVGGAALPRAAANVAQTLGSRVEDDRVVVRHVAELAARDAGDFSVRVAIENAAGVEHLYAEFALQRADDAEHRIDRAAGCLAVLLRGDGEKRSLAQLAAGEHRDVMRGPLIE